jgi:hypothetical protein
MGLNSLNSNNVYPFKAAAVWKEEQGRGGGQYHDWNQDKEPNNVIHKRAIH